MNVKLLMTYPITLLLLASSVISANERKEERIYQVEVIIFERAAQPSTLDTEKWPKNISLSYPANRKKLIDPFAPKTQDLHSNAKNKGISLSKTFIDSLSNQNNHTNNTQHTSPKDPQLSSGSSSSSSSSSNNSDYLTFLDDSQKILTTQRNALGRTRGLQVLFHQAWIQPLTEPKQAPALLMKGGKPFGEHHELEGSIRISVNRYLHIETDLWLTHFTPNYGQLPEHWPNLPSQEKEYFWSDTPAQMKPHNTKPSYGITSPEQNTPAFNTDYNQETRNYGYALNDADQSEEPYLIKEIITLRQKRKMKSNELHYIDHPRMGLIIKIIPFTPSPNEENTDENQKASVDS